MTFAMPGNFDSQVFASTFFAQVYNFGPDHTSRAAKYQNCWDFYDGRHWSQQTPEGFDQLTVNYSKAFVKKMRRFTFRNGWTMNFSDEQRNDKIDTWVNDVWKHNDAVDLTNKIAEFGGIFGDWYIYPQWLPDEELDKDTPKSSQVKLTVLDPRYVYPQYNNKTGEMDFCVILIPYEEVVLKGNEFEYTNRVYREVHTKEKIFVQELDEKNNVVFEKVIENPLGKLLVVHGIHQPKAGSHFGAGLIEDVIGAQKLFNEKVSNISEILDYHAAPITIIFGAKARALEKGANKIWSGLPATAKVENLKSDGNITEAKEFVGDTKRWMHELANIPEEALGKERDISNTSAVALSIDFEPMIELSEDVRFYFEKGIRQVNELVIDIGIYLEEISTKLKMPVLYDVDIEFGELLPRDRTIDLANMQQELTMGIESKIGAMKRLGVKEAEQKLEEIRNEQEEDKKIAFEQSQKYMDPMMAAQISALKSTEGGGPTSKGGAAAKKDASTKAANANPKVHGQQVSDNARKAKQ